MKVIKKGDGKINWSLEVECTGKGWTNKNKSCNSSLNVEDGDIVKRSYRRYGDESSSIAYGFICPICNVFTEVDEKILPKEIMEYCKSVAAKGSDSYSEIDDEEKKLSEVL